MTSAHDKFLGLLKDDILKLDLAELDFGIYRILNYRRREIDTFLDRELPLKIDAALAKLPGAAGEDEQGRIFHHLYTFFSRYYDDGDFVTRPRRGRNAAYSVPYNGQDVHFWWATKGSHYVKSGERFGSYVWRDGPRAIRIEITQADIEKDNAKGEKRYYVPEAIEEGDDALRVKLAYRKLDADEVKRYDMKRATEADEDEDNGGEAIDGKSTQERILNAWLEGAGPRKAKVPGGVDKTLLKKHVARYVAGQTSDFFVHPQLREFLDGELEYYLKDEFMQVWDRADGDALARERGKLAVVREIGQLLIAFLATIEDVQAALFEKRKFVLRNDYLVRVSALDASHKTAQTLIGEACANAAQVGEWLDWLGEKPLPKSANEKTIAKRGAELLAAYPHLCIHTNHFDERYKYSLSAQFEDLEEATAGILIHAENYAALRTLEYACQRQIKCIYIDPPYNADTSPIAYKNEFPESSWISLIEDRLAAVHGYLDQAGVLCVTIDDYEVHELGMLLERKFGHVNQLGTVVIRNNPSGRSTASGLSVCHEYAFFYGGPEATLKRLPRSEKQLARFSEEEGVVVDWRNFRKDGGAVTHRAQRPKQYYPIYVGQKTHTIRIPLMNWNSTLRQWDPVDKPEKGEIAVFPIDEKGRERVWSLYHISAREQISDLAVRADRIGNPQIYRRHTPSDGVLPRSWWDKNTYAAREYGSSTLMHLFGTQTFSFAKSPFAVQDCIWVSGLSEDSTETVLDYFAGSGTTGHAVINLNRDDDGARKFILVEQGEYFDTVLLPRIAKVIAAPEWKDGKPKPGQSMRAVEGEDAETHWSARSPKIVQMVRLERYEDSLDALELPDEAEARRAGQMSFTVEPLRYVYEAAAASASVALNTAHLSTPFDLTIPQVRDGAPVLVPVDIAATALLLLGLHPVRVRDLRGKAGRNGKHRYLLIEARPNGDDKALHLLVLRNVDESITDAALKAHAQAESGWLTDVIRREFGHAPGDYGCVWHNRDLYLKGAQGRSLDSEVARRMLERAPVTRAQ